MKAISLLVQKETSDHGKLNQIKFRSNSGFKKMSFMFIILFIHTG